MITQYAVQISETPQQFLSFNGKFTFLTLEEAQLAAAEANLPNMQFFKREVSPWEFIGDMISSPSGEFK